MPNIWFTADFRLGHKNIIRYCNCPFDSVEAMNCAILERLNSAVRANDVAPRARFELATLRLTAECSTVELPGNRTT